jgi:F-box and WD-40 domain protein CDC4
MNWRNGGHLLCTHRPPVVTSESGVITSVALDTEWVVVGLANCKIYVFSAKTGVLSRTLIGHELGVWAVNLVSRGGFLDDGPECADRPRASREDGTVVADLESGLDGVSLHDGIGTQSSKHSLLPSFRTALGLGKPPVRRTGGLSAAGGVGKQGDVCCASEGWGQPSPLVVSGGCDKVLCVWDVKSG